MAIELRLLAVPGDEELVRDHAGVVEIGAASDGKFLLVRVLIAEELDNGLKQVLLATISVLLKQGGED